MRNRRSPILVITDILARELSSITLIFVSERISISFQVFFVLFRISHAKPRDAKKAIY